jgi:hypothetical protein
MSTSASSSDTSRTTGLQRKLRNLGSKAHTLSIAALGGASKDTTSKSTLTHADSQSSPSSRKSLGPSGHGHNVNFHAAPDQPDEDSLVMIEDQGVPRIGDTYPPYLQFNSATAKKSSAFDSASSKSASRRQSRWRRVFSVARSSSSCTSISTWPLALAGSTELESSLFHEACRDSCGKSINIRGIRDSVTSFDLDTRMSLDLPGPFGNATAAPELESSGDTVVEDTLSTENPVEDIEHVLAQSSVYQRSNAPQTGLDSSSDELSESSYSDATSSIISSLDGIGNHNSRSPESILLASFINNLHLAAEYWPVAALLESRLRTRGRNEDESPQTRDEFNGNRNGTHRASPEAPSGELKRSDTIASSNGKRRRAENDSDDESGDEDGNQKPRKRKNTPKKFDGPRLACPFFQKAPATHDKFPSCAGPGWPTVHRVK